jgi:hypothetical protein
MSNARREEIWYVLSDVFVDNEVDYSYIAGKIVDEDINQLKEIFFTEVALFCTPNLMTAIPPIWEGFSRQPLIDGIHKELKRFQSTPFARLQHKLFVMFYRWRFADYWKNIERELKNRKPTY